MMGCRLQFPLPLFSTCKSRPSSASTIPSSSSRLHSHCNSFTQIRSASPAPVSNTAFFTWDDVFQVSQPHHFPDDSSNLSGYLDKIQFCNRGSELQSEFLQFIIDDQLVGYVHSGFADQYLKRFSDVFVFPRSDSNGSRLGSYVTLHERLKTAEDRTRLVAQVIKCLGEEQVVTGIRNEMYPVVSSFGSPPYFSLERAAAPYFGIKAYEVHTCGFVGRDGEKFLWLGKRSAAKQTYPGMLDHLAAGGLPYGMSSGESMVKECEEEAGIPPSISKRAIPVGAVSYMHIEGFRFTRDVVFCYDLELPESFIPECQDGEVEGFKLLPVKNVANVIRRTNFFKPNCSLVNISFLFRHGYINPGSAAYLDLLQSLQNGECS